MLVMVLWWLLFVLCLVLMMMLYLVFNCSEWLLKFDDLMCSIVLLIIVILVWMQIGWLFVVNGWYSCRWLYGFCLCSVLISWVCVEFIVIGFSQFFVVVGWMIMNLGLLGLCSCLVIVLVILCDVKYWFFVQKQCLVCVIRLIYSVLILWWGGCLVILGMVSVMLILILVKLGFICLGQ